MKATTLLHDLGQSIWLDNITRTMLDDATLAGYIDELHALQPGAVSQPQRYCTIIAKGDEVRWMRFTLDTVGKTTWTVDRQERPIYTRHVRNGQHRAAIPSA